MKKYSLLLIFSVFIFNSCGTESIPEIDSKPIYILITSVNGEGTITPSSGKFEEGESITLTSNSHEGWVFQEWSGDISGSSTSISITMNSDKEVIGNFIKREYPLNITIEGEGTVEETIVQSKSTDYPHGTVVELTPIPSSGWEFVGWGGDLSGSNSPQSITVYSEKNVSVIFKQNNFFLHENGVTIMCPDTQPGDVGMVDGVEYESVDRNLFIQKRDSGGDLSNLCTTLITDMSTFFCSIDERSDCHPNYNTLNPPIIHWDVSNVTTMEEMFYYSQRFNQPLEYWDVSNVTNMSRMFGGERTVFNQPLGEWDVSNVTDMSEMFRMSPFSQPLEGWDVSSVTDMRKMFSSSDFNQPIENWDVSNVTDMSGMFMSSQFNQPIENWDVRNVTNMRTMFWGSLFNKSIEDWDVSSVTDMSYMFVESDFNQSIENWDVSNVTDMSGMFWGSLFNKSIEDWDVSSVTDMSSMFQSSSFNQDISSWCVSQITSEPSNFSSNAPLTEENKPVWGTCPH